MAREVYAFTVTIPPNTPQNSLFAQQMTIPVRRVSTLEIVVPPGPSGLMGFVITMGGIRVIPSAIQSFIITDDERITWPLTDQPTSGAWQLSGYNTDVWPHSVYLRWLVDLVDTAPAGPLLSATTLGQLSS